MNSSAAKVIDVAVLLLVPLVYSAASGKEYAEALGFALGGGLLGLLAYRLLSKVPAVKALAGDQSGLRQYAIGCVLFAFAGVPMFVTQARADREVKEAKFAIGAALGRAVGACEISAHLKARSCPKLDVSADMAAACKTQFSSIIPVSFSDEARQALRSPRASSEVSSLLKKSDEAFQIAANKGLAIPEVCAQYQQFIDATLKESVSAIVTNGARLK